ncbi:unnamed protein product [Ectocarpus fasciculatus]
MTRGSQQRNAKGKAHPVSCAEQVGYRDVNSRKWHEAFRNRCEPQARRDDQTPTRQPTTIHKDISTSQRGHDRPNKSEYDVWSRHHVSTTSEAMISHDSPTLLHANNTRVSKKIAQWREAGHDI